jgi:hypothetical protein
MIGKWVYLTNIVERVLSESSTLNSTQKIHATQALLEGGRKNDRCSMDESLTESEIQGNIFRVSDRFHMP